MRIKETMRELSAMKKTAFTESTRGIRAAEKRLESLSADDGRTGDGDKGRSRADPARYMAKEERRAWESLSEPEREEYLRQGREMAEAEAGILPGEGGERIKRGGGLQGDAGGRWDDPGDFDGERARDDEMGRSWYFRTPGTGRPDTGSAGGNGRAHGVPGGLGGQDSPEGGRLPETPVPTFGGTANGAASGAADAALQGTRTAGNVAPPGTTAGIRAAKKAAESFRDALESRGVVTDGEEEQNAHVSGKDNQSQGSMGRMASAAIATVGGMFAAVGAAFMQAAVGALASMVAVIMPVIVAVTTIASIVSVIVSIVTTPAVTIGGGSAGLLEVAVSQEGVTSGSRYWSYTMGSRFVNGSSTPWCACFVSWCANERGYIDEGLFPKSGSVAAYKAFYQARGLYRDAYGYVPRQGDLIIFGNNAHIGIVQYVEGGRVVTIEGNASDAVHTRSYSLTNSRITGYCTPDYPPEEAEEGDGTETEPNAPGAGAGEEGAEIGRTRKGGQDGKDQEVEAGCDPGGRPALVGRACGRRVMHDEHGRRGNA